MLIVYNTHVFQQSNFLNVLYTLIWLLTWFVWLVRKAWCCWHLTVGCVSWMWRGTITCHRPMLFHAIPIFGRIVRQMWCCLHSIVRFLCVFALLCSDFGLKSLPASSVWGLFFCDQQHRKWQSGIAGLYVGIYDIWYKYRRNLPKLAWKAQ